MRMWKEKRDSTRMKYTLKINGIGTILYTDVLRNNCLVDVLKKMVLCC